MAFTLNEATTEDIHRAFASRELTARELVVKLAYAYEQATNHRRPPPGMD